MSRYLKAFTTIMLFVMLFGAALPAQAEIHLPPQTHIIENEAFKGATAMEGLVVLPYGVEQLGQDAFMDTAVHALSIIAHELMP